MSTPSMSELILQALGPSPKGLQLDARKLPAVAELLNSTAKRNDPSAANELYTMVALLDRSNGAPAAQALLGLLMNPAQKLPPARGGWGSRT
jgi:hypothetical protein